MRPRTKPRIKIPGIAVIAIIIIFIGVGVKGRRYIANHSAERQQSGSNGEANSTKTVGAMNLLLYGSAQKLGPLSDYDVIAEANLLNPLGWQKTVAVQPPSRPVIQRSPMRQMRPEPTNDLVFTGIVNLGDGPMALVEDTSSGEAYFLKEGDVLKNYVVKSIGEESIVLANEDSTLTPDLGSKVYYRSNGQILLAGMGNDQTTANLAESDDENPASSSKNPANLSLIERMRARRREELEQE